LPPPLVLRILAVATLVGLPTLLHPGEALAVADLTVTCCVNSCTGNFDLKVQNNSSSKDHNYAFTTVLEFPLSSLSLIDQCCGNDSVPHNTSEYQEMHYCLSGTASRLGAFYALVVDDDGYTYTATCAFSYPETGGCGSQTCSGTSECRTASGCP